MGATAEVLLDGNGNNGVFTNEDEVKGKVIVVVEESITVNQIQVRFEGVSKVTVTYRKSTGNSSRNVHVTNKHRLISKVVTVFPPQNEREVMCSSEFTLVSGTYEYPFSFKIPMMSMCLDNMGTLANKDAPDTFTKQVDHGVIRFGAARLRARPKSVGGTVINHIPGMLPPSFSLDDRASINYHVKAIIMRPSMFSRNVRSFGNFTFIPYDLGTAPISSQFFETRSPFFIKSKGCKPIECSFYFRCNKPYYYPGDLLDVSISVEHEPNADISGLTTLYIDQVKFKFVTKCELSAIEKSWSNNVKHTVTLLNNPVILDKSCKKFPVPLGELKLKLGPQNNQFILPPELYACAVPQNIVPTFGTCNVALSYFLEISITYSLDLKAKGGFIAVLKGNQLSKAKLVSNELLIKGGINPPLQASLHVQRPQHEPHQEQLPEYSGMGKHDQIA